MYAEVALELTRFGERLVTRFALVRSQLRAARRRQRRVVRHQVLLEVPDPLEGLPANLRTKTVK